MSDIDLQHWSLRLLPPAWRGFARMMRLDRPIGWWLLLFPCWWSLALAFQGEQWPLAFWYAVLFLIGAVVMRGAGCVVNDLWDHRLDAQVARTATRPLPSGEVTRKQAFLLLAILLAIGLLVLVQFNWATIFLASASLLLVALYPLAKRITHWPQLVLGLTFNWGALVGWTAWTGSLGWPAVALYGAGLFWTLSYDTIYAHQDKDDDSLIGIKSSALALGDQTKPWVTGFILIAASFLGAAGWAADAQFGYYLFTLAAVLLFLTQLARVALDQPTACLLMFKQQIWVGWLLVLACLFA